MDILLSELLWLLSRAELVGSRGRCRYYGLPEPAGADYDWTIYTDDPACRDQAIAAMKAVAACDPSFSIINREDPKHRCAA